MAALALVGGCESTALNQADPTVLSYAGALSPPFYACLADDVDSYDVVVTFVSAQDLDDNRGGSEDRDLQFDTDCEDLQLESWSFQSNFQFTLELSRFATQETHDCDVQVNFINHYGAFEVRDTLTLFACTGVGG